MTDNRETAEAIIAAGIDGMTDRIEAALDEAERRGAEIGFEEGIDYAAAHLGKEAGHRLRRGLSMRADHNRKD